MKAKIIYLIVGILLIFVECDKTCVDCENEFLFMQTYSENINKEGVFFIKGVAGKVRNYGRKIEIIEDFKGNFTDKSTIFLWGVGGRSSELNKVDYITEYGDNDTLIIIMEHACRRYVGDVENKRDYTTIKCSPSVLQLSNDFVTGWIKRDSNTYAATWTMSWIEFQEELEIINKK